MRSVIIKGEYGILLRAFLFVIFLFNSILLVSQNITVDNSLSPQTLIQNNLVEGCVEVSNITSTINGSVNGFSSFGYFERDLSNFPFENGIVLATGNANSGGNAINTNILNDGDLSWGTDPDLENALGISNTYNATSIEFDFVSISNNIQFNYILASEEYFGNFPCEYSDGFAFLIREAGTNDPYTNIALIPGTSIPVNTNTIHDEIVGFCAAENENYFDGYNMGDTNYNGRTSVLTATANISPNVQYHIKLVIADQTDENYDSAVFIQGNSFTPTVDLGPDVNTCALNYTINGDISNPLATYSWYLNNSLLNGETNTSLNVNSSGHYRVEITIPLNDQDCIIEDTIEITLNSEQTTNNISDLVVCDDISNDGTETFDLSIKNDEVLTTVPDGNYTISYHLDQNDAQNNINSINNPIQNTSSPQNIVVRIEDNDNGCIIYTSFNLIVNSLPTITQPNPLVLCDDAIADGSTTVDLTLLDSEITNNNNELVVTYHYSEVDANNGDNPIAMPYVNTNPNETVYIRVVNSTTDCLNTTAVEISVLENPEVDIDNIPPLNACENDGDGFANFDLSEVIPDIIQGLTDTSVTFHLNAEDAENGNNPIGDITNFENTVQNVQILYVRVESDLTGCFTIVPVELHTNLLQSGTNIIDFYYCDDESGDGISEWNLINIANSIINDLTNVTVTFYETQEDLDNNVNAIDQNTPYIVTNTPHTLFIKIETPDCEYHSEIQLITHPPLVLDPIDVQNYCDTDDDGFTSIELSQFDDIILNGITDASVSYFLTEDDAINDINALPPFYTNTTNPQVFYANARYNETGCYDTAPFEINVIPAPTVSQPNDIVICDDDQDAFSIIDLDALIPEIVTNTTDLNISFHTSLNDANNNSNIIITTNNYNASTQTIYTRVENLVTGCYALVEINVIVNTQPEFAPISNYQNCETDGNQIADFIFSQKDEEILNGQSGKQVLYFENETDAYNRINSIDKNSIYNNTSAPQTIYVRVENNTDQECFGVSSFELEIGSIPIFTPPSNFLVCDDISNDGIELFDLNEKIFEITQNSPENLTVTFHTSYENAENAENDIELQYNNIENPQQIYARIENGTYCHAIAEFGLNVIQVPTVNLPSSLQFCDSDYDGTMAFDLTVSEFEILDVRDDDIVISYFENEEDLEANTNSIQSPENYSNISNPQTVYVKVENTISECYVSIPLELIVDIPPVINEIPQIEICDNVSDTFNLNEATSLLFNDTNNIIISYHLELTDAENNIGHIGENYTYQNPEQVVYVRAEDLNSGCTSISSFNLNVNPLPIANTPQDLEDCDDDHDFILEFDLSQQTAYVLGSQDPDLFVVNYFESEEDSFNNENPIQDLNYFAFDEQMIYIRVENIETGCYDTTSFSVVINRKPLVEIPDQTICLDNLPLTVFAGEVVEGDSYLWSTNETSSEIEINEIGVYSVTVTTPYGCETTTTFNVIESEPANIEVTETIDFSDPNNITITVSGIGNYLYILDNGEPQESNVFENVTLGYHTITVIDLNGCSQVTEEVVVIDAPKFFTPNNDGYFDTWHIVGIEHLEGTTINIFDRYGKLIKNLSWDSLGWDGNYNGKMMPSNDYWFIADVKKNGVEFQVKGHFALKR